MLNKRKLSYHSTNGSINVDNALTTTNKELNMQKSTLEVQNSINGYKKTLFKSKPHPIFKYKRFSGYSISKTFPI